MDLKLVHLLAMGVERRTVGTACGLVTAWLVLQTYAFRIFRVHVYNYDHMQVHRYVTDTARS